MTGRYRRDSCVSHVARWLAREGEKLDPDRFQVERFLERLDPGAERFSFRCFSDTEYTRLSGYDPLERELHGSLKQCWSELRELNRLGAAISVTVNQTNGTGRRVEDIQRVRALFLDYDRVSDPAPFPLTPHLRVQTSSRHCHYYWFVDGVGLEVFQGAQRQLAERFQGDSRVCALNQSMQLPGFWRRKQAGSPCMPLLIQLSKRKNYSFMEILPLIDVQGESMRADAMDGSGV